MHYTSISGEKTSLQLLRLPSLIRFFYTNRSCWICHENSPLVPLGVSLTRKSLGYNTNIGQGGSKHPVIVFGFFFHHLNTPQNILGRLLPEVKSLLLFILQLSLPKSSLGTTNPSL